MKLIIYFFILSAFLFTTPIFAQQKGDDSGEKNGQNNEEKESPSRKLIWGAKLPGGEYYAALNGIMSVSMHSYLIGESHTVHEVVIETAGSAIVRFYTIDVGNKTGLPTPIDDAIENHSTSQLLSDPILGDDTPDTAEEPFDPTTVIVKKTYPNTTHAKTIEYRLSTKSQLDRVFQSALRAWRNNRGTTISIK